MAALSALAAYDDDADDDNLDDDNEEGATAVIVANNITQKNDDKPVDVATESVSGDNEKTSPEKSELEVDDGRDEDQSDNPPSAKEEDDNEDMILSADESSSEKNLNGSLDEPAQIKTKRYSCENATALAAKLKTLSEADISVPPEPDKQASLELQNKIRRLYEKKIREGENLNQAIQSRKDFRNPSIYDKLILFLGIEERGTNFPKEEFDPDFWRKCPSYEDLARSQREEMAKKDKEKKTKVEFVTGTVKKPSSAPGSGDNPKRTKWDRQDDKSSSAAGQLSGSVSIASSSAGSKPTIISAVGTIKKAKQ